VISHVARLSTFKGTDKLLRVLPQVCARTGRNVVLLLVGRNLEEDTLDGLVRDLGVGAHVRFTGPLPERDLHLAYAASDVFALPSQYESLGFVFLEAMAHGVPVIGVRTGGVAEVIRDGETGFVLDSCDDLESLTDSLVRLVENEALRARLGEKAREWTHRHFNWPAAADAVKAIVWELSQ
jgi:phosphatidylinositol alpha-1,6-mannosyltransferase